MTTKVESKKNADHVEVHLGYYKQGDDMYGCIVEKNGRVDIKATIANHVKLLESVVTHLNELNKLIPEDNDLELHADTHFIGLSGNKEVLQKLVDAKLANFDDFDDDDYSSDTGSYSGSDYSGSDSEHDQ